MFLSPEQSDVGVIDMLNINLQWLVSNLSSNERARMYLWFSCEII
jgi:hypothetical protein